MPSAESLSGENTTDNAPDRRHAARLTPDDGLRPSARAVPFGRADDATKGNGAATGTAGDGDVGRPVAIVFASEGGDLSVFSLDGHEVVEAVIRAIGSEA